MPPNNIAKMNRSRAQDISGKAVVTSS